MKKKLVLMVLTAAFAFMTGCADASSDPNKSFDDSPVSYVPPNGSASSENSGLTENHGGPAFLVCPDGTPVRENEIRVIYAGIEEFGERRDTDIDEAYKLAREGGDFTVICDGFAYGFIPENTVNRIDYPDMFEDNGGSFRYIGAENLPSSELIRYEVGGKFGPLTIKSASACFGNASNLGSDVRAFSEKPGVFLRGGSMELEGEVEITGYASVTAMDALYGIGGDLEIYPDRESAAKLPSLLLSRGEDGFPIRRYGANWYGFYGSYALNAGNIVTDDISAEFLRPGDSFVKVKATLSDIKFKFDPNMGMTRQSMTVVSISPIE